MVTSIVAQPSVEYGEINTDDEERFKIEVYQVSETQFKDYVKACREKGFVIETTETDSVFYAYHEDEYELDIFYWEDKNTIEIFLDAPLLMAEIKWPDNKLVNQIPQPKSLIGNIRWENSEHFGTYIANMADDEYDEYVDLCMEVGFTVDYSRGEKTFHAYHIAVNGQAIGPFGLDVLEQMVTSGQLTTETLAWKNGMEQWYS